jgi:DNA-directed RNA polymerase specialized sigma24 family protein
VELHDRRAELVGQLRRRSEARGVPVAAQEEIVDDAITAVVMSPRGIANEHHLLGAFWLAVSHRCRRYREGRHFTRLGSRVRVDLDTAVEHTPGGANPLDRLELRDRFGRAADLMADLDAREQQVVSVMAIYGVGPVPAARYLGLPLGEVRSAARSANAKLDRVAVIAAAGRMCDYRYEAIAAKAAGEASEDDARLARAHVNACLRCGRVYRKLRREMRGREFQRAAAAAFLPVPAPLAHVGGLGRLAAWFEQHTPGLPHGGGERAAEVLGGAGAMKVAAVGTAVVIAGGSLTSHIVRSVVDSHAQAPHSAGHILHETSSQSFQPAGLARAWASPTSTTLPLRATPTRRERVPARHNPPSPPSKSLGYLALGGSSGSTSPAGSPPGSASSSPARAVVASVDQYPRNSTNTSTASSSSEASPQPSSPRQSGGGTNLGYLGR